MTNLKRGDVCGWVGVTATRLMLLAYSNQTYVHIVYSGLICLKPGTRLVLNSSPNTKHECYAALQMHSFIY